MKKNLTRIETSRGVVCNVAFYADTPGKNYRIYYCGSDIGERFEYLGNAARYLEKLVKIWENNGLTGIKKRYAARDEIPRRGSNA